MTDFCLLAELSVGHSSGYESMRTDNASGAESACELGGSGRRKKKRFLGKYSFRQLAIFFKYLRMDDTFLSLLVVECNLYSVADTWLFIVGEESDRWGLE